MKAGRFILALLIPLAFSACGTMRDIGYVTIGSEFDQSLRAYARLVRWHEMESAMAHVSPSVFQAYRDRIPPQGKVQITDYRVVSMECNPAGKVGKATVEFEVYLPPSITVHRVKDLQQWSYEGPEGRGTWRLKTLLPDFK